jgi:hypothetical protein
MITEPYRSSPDAPPTSDPNWGGSQRFYLAILLALTLVYAALISLNAGRHLSFDELLTYNIAKAPTIAGVLHFLRKWDLNPPVVHLLAHYSMLALGKTAFALRLPSILEFYVASLALFAYVSRKVGAAYAPIPVVVLWYSPMFQYATEARPYALLAMFFCCLLLCWDTAVNSQNRKLALWGIGISNAGLIASHVFAPLSLLPFLAAEAVRWRRQKRPDYPVWAGLLLPMFGMLGYIPLYHTYKTLSFYPPAFQASFHHMASFYWHTAWSAFLPVCLALLVAILMSNHRVHLQPLPRIRPVELSLFGLLLLNPILLNLVLMRDQAAFWPRYCITSVFAIYALLAMALAWIFRYKAAIGYGMSAILAALLIALNVLAPLYKMYFLPPPAKDAAILEHVRPDLPIVAASGLTFVELGHYEKRELLSRVFYLKDRTSAIAYANATIFEDLDRVQKDFALPGHVEAYANFVRCNPHFLVLGTPDYPEDWLLRKLADEGARIKLIGTYTFPYKDKRLYEITLH